MALHSEPNVYHVEWMRARYEEGSATLGAWIVLEAYGRDHRGVPRVARIGFHMEPTPEAFAYAKAVAEAINSVPLPPRNTR
jgi:hypothetical protein